MTQSDSKPSFIVQDSAGSILIQFPAVIDQQVSDEFSVASKSWLLSSPDRIIFDLGHVKEIKTPAYRAFVAFHQLLAKAKVQHTSINTPGPILKQIREDGLMSVFNPALKPAAQAAPSKAKNPFDLVLVNAFCQATKKVLEVQANVQVTILKPTLVKMDEKEVAPNISIAGILNLATDTFHGSLTIAFSSEVFLKIYERMMGESHTEITTEIEDAAGEILNIIYGTAKTELNQQPGYNLKPVLPTVLAGEKLKIRQKTDQLIVQLPFDTDLGRFYFEIAVEKTVLNKVA